MCCSLYYCVEETCGIVAEHKRYKFDTTLFTHWASKTYNDLKVFEISQLMKLNTRNSYHQTSFPVMVDTE